MKFTSQKLIQPSIVHPRCNSCESEFQKQPMTTGLNRFRLSRFSGFFSWFFTDPYEIQIWQRCDRNNQTYWYAYDPGTKQSNIFYSELDIRVWLERHSHRL